MAKQKVEAWIGLCDGKILWVDDGSEDHRKVLAEVFKTRKVAAEMYEDVRKVTLTIHQK